MKVSALIEVLKGLDGNREVVFYTSESEYRYGAGLANCSDGLECVLGIDYDACRETGAPYLYLRAVDGDDE
jgi:hypothetical protein